MVNKKRGYYTIQLGGKNRTLHFSMNFWAAFTDELGITLADIDKLFAGGLNLSEIRALIYAAILANDQEQNNIIDYNVFTVGATCNQSGEISLTLNSPAGGPFLIQIFFPDGSELSTTSNTGEVNLADITFLPPGEYTLNIIDLTIGTECVQTIEATIELLPSLELIVTGVELPS